ncbi:MAG: hypothetical protein ACYC02_07770 [Thiobacillus sp.]
MSVLKKIQFADAPVTSVADSAIIGAGAAGCQNPRIPHAFTPTLSCCTAAH